MRRHAVSLAAALFLAPLTACGGPSTPVVIAPLSAEQEVLFENGVDYIDDPTLLEGSWLDSWETEIDRRVSTADFVAFVRIATLRTDVDLERHETYRLIAHVDSLRFGDSRSDDIELVSREGTPGFGTVRGNDARILNQRFVLFARWTQAEPGGPLEARWHLSPASERVVRRVNSLVEARRSPDAERRRVIVHDQSN